MFEEILSMLGQKGAAFGQELIRWMASVQKHAIGKWSPVVMASIACSRSDGRRVCQAQAMAACEICGEGVCLRHACIAPNADVVCTACLHTLAERAIAEREAGMPPPRPGTREALDPVEIATRRQYLELLGLGPGADAEALHAAHKQLSKRWHPDRHPSPAAHARAEAEYKRIQVAYQWLKEHGTGQKAA